MARGVVATAYEVVQRDVEVVREGDKDKCRWDSSTIFVPLICLFCNIDTISNLFLCKALFGSDFFKLDS